MSRSRRYEDHRLLLHTKTFKDMKVRFKKLNDAAVLPSYAHQTDAGLDMTATSREIDDEGNVVYGFGLAVEIPAGYVGLLFPRSSVAKKGMVLSNSVGCVDSGYRGEVKAKFKVTPDCAYIKDKMLWIAKRYSLDAYEVGDRVCQLIIIPYPKIEPEFAEELSSSDRGDGGYGSSGR